MDRDKLCSAGKIFVEDEKYVLVRYEARDMDLYLKIWKETFENSIVYNDENFKMKSWENVLLDTNKLQLKVIDKSKLVYVGEVSLQKLDTKNPEIGIHLLRKYRNQKIGTQVIKLFVNKLKNVFRVDYFLVRIFSDNFISQKMFEKIGAVKIGEEGKEYAELMYKIMQEMGKEKFEETIKQDFEKTQQFIIRYKIEV